MSLEMMKKRMQYNDANAQDRMIKRKQAVLKDSIERSYFGMEITRPDIKDETPHKVLITSASSSLSDSETKKYISSFFEVGLDIGSIVHWIRDDSYWLIYEKERNEIAYFLGKMIQAKNYQISTGDGKYSTWGSIALTLNEIEEKFDRTLLTGEDTGLTIMIPDNEQNRQVFVLDTKIKVLDTTWKIYNTDYISRDGIITIKAKRSFDSVADIQIDENNNIVNDNTYIQGPNSIIPFEKAVYTVAEGIEGEWAIPDNPNIQKTINNDNSLEIVWTNGRKRNDFTISFGEYSKEIRVESLM